MIWLYFDPLSQRNRKLEPSHFAFCPCCCVRESGGYTRAPSNQ
jgi:hypothetical protein